MYKQSILLTVFTLSILLIPVVIAEGSFQGEYAGNTESSSSGTFTGEATAATHVQRSYLLSSLHVNDMPQGTTTIFNNFQFDRFGTEGVNISTSRTQFEVMVGVRLNPSGIASASFSAHIHGIGSGAVPNVCTITFSRATGSGPENVYHRCLSSVGYVHGKQNVTVTITGSNFDTSNVKYGVTIHQYETLESTRAYTITGTVNSESTGTSFGLVAGNISNATFGSGNNTTMLADQITIIDGDTNLPIMRIYAWIVGVSLFFIFLAEWKKDAIYHFLAMIALLFVVTEMPDFFPDLMRALPIAVLLYQAYRIIAVGGYLARKEDSTDI